MYSHCISAQRIMKETSVTGVPIKETIILL